MSGSRESLGAHDWKLAGARTRGPVHRICQRSSSRYAQKFRGELFLVDTRTRSARSSNLTMNRLCQHCSLSGLRIENLHRRDAAAAADAAALPDDALIHEAAVDH